MLHPKKILVPVDFSEESAMALEWAVRLASSEQGASIVLCHVLKTAVAPVGPEMMMYDLEAMLRESAEKDLARWQEKVPSSIESHTVLSKGRVSEEVTQICQKENIDLVVMTTHGRTGLSHWVVGSAAEETVRLAPCPVLVLHLNENARKELAKMA